MPSAKKKRKTKRLKPLASSAGEDRSAGFTEDIDHAESWNIAVDILCQSLDLPDITTLRGLREARVSFETIYDSLDKCLVSDDDRYAGAVVSVYAKMAVDSKIRDLLLQKDVLSKIRPLFDRPFCRMVALQAYAALTHHIPTFETQTKDPVLIDPNITVTIAALLKLVKENPSDSKLIELCFTVLSEITSPLVTVSGFSLTKDMQEEAHIPELIQAFTESITPTSPYFLLRTAFDFLSKGLMAFPEQLREFPDTIDWLLTSVRSKDAFRRSHIPLTLSCFDFGADGDSLSYDFERFQSVPYITDRDNDTPNAPVRTPTEGSAPIPNLQPRSPDSPPHGYGRAMERFEQDADYRILAHTLANMIVQGGAHSLLQIPIPTYRPEASSIDPSSGLELEVAKPNSTATAELADVLLRCVMALKRDPRNVDLETLSVLQIAFYMKMSRLENAQRAAWDAIDQFPDHPFFRLALAIISTELYEHDEGIRMAKKGLELCDKTDTNQHLRLDLRFYAGLNADALGTSVSTTALPYAEDGINVSRAQEKADGWWGISFMFLASAYKDLKIVMDADSGRPEMLLDAVYFYTNVLLTLKGDKLDEDLTELMDVSRRLDEIDRIYIAWYGVPPPITQPRLKCKLILTRLRSASNHWYHIVKHFDELYEADPERDRPLVTVPNANRLENDFRDWLAGPRRPRNWKALVIEQFRNNSRDDPLRFSGKPEKAVHVSRRVIPNAINIHFCSYCHKTSASLKKCKGCGETRYCDSMCQEKHWRQHRLVCREN